MSQIYLGPAELGARFGEWWEPFAVTIAQKGKMAQVIQPR